MRTLILGGARSGKSRTAEEWAAGSGRRVVYVATATAEDDEMRERIEAHRRRRPAEWALVEEPRALGRVIRERSAADTGLLVDCLTLWLAGWLTADPGGFPAARADFLASLENAQGEIFLVGNETGSGVVPLGVLSRTFVDEAGRLHQDVGRLCERVVLMVAGIPLWVKGEPR